MYAFIRGKVEYKGMDSAVIEAGGVGYEVFVSTRTLANLPAAGEPAMVYTYLHVREDVMQLYGFGTREEKAMFVKLLGVTGVGPKMAMGILSGLTVAELAIALVTKDTRSLSRISGVGKKTAERLILELCESVGKDELIAAPQAVGAAVHGGGAAQEAIQALMALGYSSIEASRAVGAAGDVGSVEEIIMRALKALDRR
jgi:holliday junction DNA helicase RuvA